MEFLVVCNKCRCKFKYNIKDIYYQKVRCPECKNEVSHPDQSNKLPYFFGPGFHNKFSIFFLKVLIYIVIGLSIWYFASAKYRGTEKDVDENIVAEEIGEGVEDVVEAV